MYIYKTCFFLILSLFILSCSNTDNISTSNETAKFLYETAIQEANNKNYENANNTFQSILEEFPYSIWATKSKVMMAWVYYEGNKYDNSINIAESFVKDHPENDLVPYALYLIAMSYYERIFDVERDSRMTILAKEAFEKLIFLYPNSEYSRDSKLKVELARSNLAGKQMSIGRFYQKQKHFAAAIRRFQRVIDEFETTDQTPEALLRLTECYLSLGLTEEALRTASVLKYNFPQSSWTIRIPKNIIEK
tara:strand:- start:448 stop:1194 length:747 start_codon:yes stop_codon:yes gene_type:complete